MITNVKVLKDEESHVTKLVIEFGGDVSPAIAETVLYRYPDYQTRTVVCFSVQSGCPIGCTFCGTGKNFVRNLSYQEIVDQVTRAMSFTGIDPGSIEKLQLMSMSMGEPFLNMKNLTRAMTELKKLYPNCVRLVSTSGPRTLEAYYRFIDYASFHENSDVGLQFSIHESTDEKRDILIPFEKKLNLSEIATLGMQFFFKTGRKPFINYCTHSENSSDKDADRLLNLFDPEIFECTISVICSKERDVPKESDTRIRALDFGQRMLDRGFGTRVFDPAGQDTIGGGCGQLWHTQNWMKKHKENVNVF